MTLKRQDSIAALSAISRGDLTQLERYLREGGANKEPVSVSDEVVGLESPQEGRLVLVDRAEGFSATLPPATGSQDRYTIVVKTTLTGDGVIKAAGEDIFVGTLSSATASVGSASAEAADGTDNTITMNGGSSGGGAGSIINLIDITAGVWLVDGKLVASGSATSSLSAT